MTWAAVAAGGVAIGGALLGGATNKKAAEQSAAAQLDATRLATEESKAAREQARADLMPFSQFGLGALPQLGEMLTPEGQTAYVEQNNPIFQAVLDDLNRRTAINAAISGRTGAGDTNQQYMKNWQAAAMPLIQNQQSMLFNAGNLGQASAAGQANASQIASADIGDYTTSGGAAQAGGIVGAANARTGMYQDLARGISSFSGMFGGFE